MQEKISEFVRANFGDTKKWEKDVLRGVLGRSVTIYGNIYNRFAYYGNIENTLLGMSDR